MKKNPLITILILTAIMFLLASCKGGGSEGSGGGGGTTPYFATGILDTTFGANGIVLNKDAEAYAMILDTSGRILVAGRQLKTPGWVSFNMAIWRYKVDGTPDTAFGSNGIAVYGDAAGGNDSGNAVALDAGGRILVTGVSGPDMAIWRYNADGTPDTTFGTNGIVVSGNAAGGNGQDAGNAIALDSRGRIVVTGMSLGSSCGVNIDNYCYDMVIWRYNADGTPDTTFGANGIVVSGNAAGGNGWDSGKSIALDPSGRILVTGMSDAAIGNPDMVIWRYNADGTPDTIFGANGIVVSGNVAGGNGRDAGNAVALDPSGRILVTGLSDAAIGNPDMVIWCYNADGTPDTTFGMNGIVVTGNAAGGDTSLGSQDAGNAVALDPSGMIVVAGFSVRAWGGVHNGGIYHDMVVWRYNIIIVCPVM